MKILVVGGTGMIGGHAALYLKSKGHAVSVAGRRPPPAGTPLAALPFLRGDYIANDFPREALAQFDAVVFAAGNDIRHVAPADLGGGSSAIEAHFQRSNVEGVPRFFKTVREAGVPLAIHIGSFYPQAAPQLEAGNAYIRSRRLADEGVRALATDKFRVLSLNAPFVVGHTPGIEGMFKAYTQYARGRFAPMPEFAPPGGVNFISCQSLSEAVEGALARGENGKAYLVGDENVSFERFFGDFFRAAGRAAPPAKDQEHPMLPDAALYFGRGNTLYYEPEASETKLLGYRRKDITRAIQEIVAAFP
jgi:nucleoside-diphosphate-sugar epimerase